MLSLRVCGSGFFFNIRICGMSSLSNYLGIIYKLSERICLVHTRISSAYLTAKLLSERRSKSQSKHRYVRPPTSILVTAGGFRGLREREQLSCSQLSGSSFRAQLARSGLVRGVSRASVSPRTGQGHVSPAHAPDSDGGNSASRADPAVLLREGHLV